MQNNNSKFKIELENRIVNYGIKLILTVKTVDYRDIAAVIIAKQVIRSGTSIGANFVEVQAGRTRKDFTNFLEIALKSANETMYWLQLMSRANLLSANNAESLSRETEEIANILGSSIATLKGFRKI